VKRAPLENFDIFGGDIKVSRQKVNQILSTQRHWQSLLCFHDP